MDSGQEEALRLIGEGLGLCDESRRREESASRRLYLKGKPGSGKSEVIVHAAVRAAEDGCKVLVLCPTGALVHSYRDRLPDSANIQIETLHSGFQIGRNVDRVVEYAPPSRLRSYELFLIDEGSQVEDAVTRLLIIALQELPQLPFVVVAADFQQLNPVGGGRVMHEWVNSDLFRPVELDTVYRTNDTELLEFLSGVREKQPSKETLQDFFHGRLWRGNLSQWVQTGLDMTEDSGALFAWLCVTNKGADKVNKAALEALGLEDAGGRELRVCFPVLFFRCCCGGVFCVMTCCLLIWARSKIAASFLFGHLRFCPSGRAGEAA